jgi:hypothetical protein
MSSVIQDFLNTVSTHGSIVVYHRDDSFTPCPCRTPEGFRDPIWHLENPSEPVCNNAGMLPSAQTANFIVKGWVQPVQSGAVRRLTTEQLIQLFGEIQSDDHLGIFPCEWDGKILNFYDWGLATEDWIEYNGRRYTSVSANLIADPLTGNPFHHWEVGLRLLGNV